MACVICNKNVNAEDIKCDGVCDRRFHASCVNLSVDQIRVIKNTPGVFWCCCDCSNPVCRILLSRLEAIGKAVPATNRITSNAPKRRSLSETETAGKLPLRPITPIPRLTRNQARSNPKLLNKNIAKVDKPGLRLTTALPLAESKTLEVDSVSCDISTNSKGKPASTVPKLLATSTTLMDTCPIDVLSACSGSKSADSLAIDLSRSVVSTNTGSIDAPVAISGSEIADIPNEMADDCGLTAAPPSQWLHIARCSTNTTTDNVRNYVSKKLGLVDKSLISCRQLLKKGADISALEFVSFKLRVPSRHLDVTRSNTFWPAGIVVKDFTTRPNFRRVPPPGIQL